MWPNMKEIFICQKISRLLCLNDHLWWYIYFSRISPEWWTILQLLLCSPHLDGRLIMRYHYLSFFVFICFYWFSNLCYVLHLIFNLSKSTNLIYLSILFILIHQPIFLWILNFLSYLFLMEGYSMVQFSNLYSLYTRVFPSFKNVFVKSFFLLEFT